MHDIKVRTQRRRISRPSKTLNDLISRQVDIEDTTVGAVTRALDDAEQFKARMIREDALAAIAVRQTSSSDEEGDASPRALARP